MNKQKSIILIILAVVLVGLAWFAYRNWINVPAKRTQIQSQNIITLQQVSKDIGIDFVIVKDATNVKPQLIEAKDAGGNTIKVYSVEYNTFATENELFAAYLGYLKSNKYEVISSSSKIGKETIFAQKTNNTLTVTIINSANKTSRQVTIMLRQS